MENYIRRELRG